MEGIKVHDIFTLRKYFSHRFDLRLSAGLADLGYELETELKPGKRGGMEYETWDIKAAPGFEAEWESVNDVKMSRRHQDIKAKEKRIVAARKERDADAPDRTVGGRPIQAQRHHAARQGQGHDARLLCANIGTRA